ncbi:inorganic pyrophosphatase Ppa [Colwellia sp. MB02u-6]|uniref:inorganic pyrophosphatase Ppa n=1 Tax=Colwellia sp. MB02u-6 TaxID=2759824 RepID=UPI0015F3CDDD|nr:inorganic pyrophosphatase Ppa [Colwellia sp. MB02u-6]MBA6327243.1 inorganic pyrophosphatase Ppa [Colwellia sp. MB02u-6]
MSYFIIAAQGTELVKYHLAFNITAFKNEHVAFSGALGKHPYDTNKVVLIAEPYAKNTQYYEFNSADIGLIEKLPNLINSHGEDAVMVLLWIKKGCVAISSSVIFV